MGVLAQGQSAYASDGQAVYVSPLGERVPDSDEIEEKRRQLMKDTLTHGVWVELFSKEKVRIENADEGEFEYPWASWEYNLDRSLDLIETWTGEGCVNRLQSGFDVRTYDNRDIKRILPFEEYPELYI